MKGNGNNHQTTKYNKGMSLVELLVAVVIFAIAIIPMLYAFVYSTGYNFKAQQTMQSTGIAQAIIEKAKAAGANFDTITEAIATDGDLLDSGVFSVQTYPSGLTPCTVDSSLNCYRLENVRAINLHEDSNNRRVYDVEIVMSPGATKTYSNIRSMSDTTANFTDNSTSFTTSLLLYEDQRATDRLIELLKSNAFTDDNITVKNSSGVVIPEDSWPMEHPYLLFGESDIDKDDLIIKRVINIDATDAGVTLSVDYYCGGFYYESVPGVRSLITSYKIDKNFTLSGTTYSFYVDGNINSPSDSYSIFTAFNTVPAGTAVPFYSAEYNSSNDFTLISGATDALFFYYYPGYKTSSSDGLVDFYDIFVINNSVDQSDVTGSDGNFNMYFYKQYNDTLTDAQLNEAEWNYSPYFSIDNSSTDMTVNFYNNFLYDVRNDDFYDSTYGLLNAHSNSYAGRLQADGSSVLLNFSGNVINRTLLPVSLAPGSTDYCDWNSANIVHDNMVSTYNMVIYVYKDGETTPIETMTSEVINW